MEGQLTFFLNEEEYLLTAGKFLIINSNEIHSIHAPEKNRTAVLQIPLKLFEEYFTAQRFIRFSRPETPDTGERKEKNRKTAFLMGEIFRVYETGKQEKSRPVGYEFKIRALFYEIMYLLVTEYRETEVQERELRYNKKLAVLSRITTYMREHYQEDLKLSQVGRCVRLLSGVFVTNVPKVYKSQFKTYLQDIRMTYAYRELMHTDKTISQIAMEQGFCTSRAFSGEFRKRYGTLPSELRRKGINEVK